MRDPVSTAPGSNLVICSVSIRLFVQRRAVTAHYYRQAKNMFRTLSYLFLIGLAAVPVAAEEWRSLIPGESTREDVVRQFPQCAGSGRHCELALPDEDVFITFSNPESCGYKPISDTVLLIERELVEPAKLESLNLDRKRFKTFDPTRPRRLGYRGYIDEKTGLALKAFNNQVFQIYYLPLPTSRNVCPAFYRNSRRFLETYLEHAPFVLLQCPKAAVTAGELVRIKAIYNRGLSILLLWEVSAGRIVQGAGRRHMTLDTTGLEGQTVTVRIERADSVQAISSDACKVVISEGSKP